MVPTVSSDATPNGLVKESAAGSDGVAPHHHAPIGVEAPAAQDGHRS
jgi:hypothetical protein